MILKNENIVLKTYVKNIDKFISEVSMMNQCRMTEIHDINTIGMS